MQKPLGDSDNKAQPIKEQPQQNQPKTPGKQGGRGKRGQPQLISALPVRAREPEVIAGAKIFEKEEIKDDFWGTYCLLCPF